MKVTKSILFLIVVLTLGSCFDPPEFPIVPEIEYKAIQFYSANGAGPDSLVLTLSFHDGDGDLGLPGDDLFYNSDPFNDVFLLQERPDAKLDTLPTNTLPWTEPGLIANKESVPKAGVYNLVETTSSTSRLATVRSRRKPEYSYLPAVSCKNYSYINATQRIAIRKSARQTVEKRSIIDSLTQPAPGGQRTTMYYILQDTFLTRYNPNHYNIEVQFLVKDANGFVEFDWRTETCSQNLEPGQTFDGRFPVLTQTSGTALDGTLRYRMNSLGFVALFSVKTLKLRFRIKDRALHNSKWVETPEFTLDKIKVR